MTIQELREKRAAKAKAARELYDNTKDWNKGTAQADYDALINEISAIDADIKRLQALLDAEAVDPGSYAPGGTNHTENNSNNDENAVTAQVIYNTFLRRGSDALNDAQLDFIAANPHEFTNVQSTGTDSEGGFLVPQFWGDSLLEEIRAFGNMRAVAQVIATQGGNQFNWPTIDDTADEGEIVAENAAVSDDDLAFGTTNINAYKYSSKVITVPFELLQDERYDLEGYIRGNLARRLARITNKHFTVGTGTNQPRGVVIDASAGKTGATATGITYDELVDLEHSLDPAHRALNPSFMFHDDTLKILKKLKDGDGRPLWRPGVTGADPDNILNYPYVINQYMAQMATGAVSMLFGNFNKYLIRDVMGVTMFRFTDSVFTRKGQVGFLAFSRHDGKCIDASTPTNAIKKFTNA